MKQMKAKDWTVARYMLEQQYVILTKANVAPTQNKNWASYVD